jgi:hypothetical protein
VYTVEEVDLLRLEKHISVWKVDLEESRGGNRKLEVLLAQHLMRESSLLMNTLRAYSGDVLPNEKSVMVAVPERKKVGKLGVVGLCTHWNFESPELLPLVVTLCCGNFFTRRTFES